MSDLHIDIIHIEALACEDIISIMKSLCKQDPSIGDSEGKQSKRCRMRNVVATQTSGRGRFTRDGSENTGG